MKRYIEYEKKRYHSLTLRIQPSTSFQYVLARMNEIQFIGCELPSEHIIYSVLELLNNSLRAHRDKEVPEPILLQFRACSQGFEIFIRDRGGGFDVHSLPYNLHSDIEEIDIHDKSFEKYRQRHNYQKFGLGLYLARRTFPYFSLNFFDSGEKEVDWGEGSVAGTQIRLRTTTAELTFSELSETEVLYEKQENI